MTRSHQILNLAGVFLPLLGVLLAVVLLWDTAVGWTSLAVLAGMYVISVMGVTLGFHRLLTHRSFATYKPVQYALAIIGSMAVQGPVMNWVADHRKHHAHTDQEGDPHTPHGHGSGLKGAVTGLWYAHMGWLFERSGTSEHERYCRDLHEDRGMRFIHKTFGLWVLLGIAIPAAIGLAIIGTRRFEVSDHSTNVFWLSVLSMGESWHHNHHTFPRSAFHGLKSWEIDPTGLVIRGMRRVKLAWNVVEITPERQQEKLMASHPPATPVPSR
jgi:stearoyl-CoA desaturase (delta-9 desaturase)